jgi:hypothetical protein
MDALQKENRLLRGELEDLMRKVSKVGLLELEMSKIHAAYNNLLKHSEKREALEKCARQKLQNVIINLTEVNKEVTERHESVMGQLMSGEPKNQNIPGLDAILRGEILRKDALITQLMNQNKMLMTNKERQDVEMVAQQETLEVSQHYMFLAQLLILNRSNFNVLGATFAHPDSRFCAVQRADAGSSSRGGVSREGHLRRQGEADDEVARAAPGGIGEERGHGEEAQIKT